MKFTKYNNPKKKRRIRPLPPKSQYVPTWGEIEYCKSMNISIEEYVDIKYERANNAKKRI